MKISVVTISYNQAKYLRQCIESVLMQDYVDFEYIVVDPGSTDGSRELIDSYGDRIIRVYEKDFGPADGLNKGFARASGDIFYFINSDDYVFNNIFSDIARHFLDNPSVDVVLAGGSRVNEDGQVECTFYPSTVSAKAYVNGAVTLFQQGMFFRASAFQRVGGFNLENKTCWDGELLLDFALNGAKFLPCMSKVAAFRIYPGSITGSQRLAAQFNADQKRMFHKVYGLECQPNSLTKIFYRIKKLLGDPVYLYKRCFN